MKCTIFQTERLTAEASDYIVSHLTKSSSVFADRLQAGESIDGTIAVVEDFGEIIGWVRSEPWIEHSDNGVAAGFGPAVLHWNTLEAFVARDWRGRGVASFAAAGLAAMQDFRDDPTAAVFHPHMMLLAHKVGLMPTLFRKRRGEWVRA